MAQRAHVIHHIPGRMRINLPHAKGNHTLLQQIKEFISPLPGVKQVQINPVTGSVIIHYDSDRHEDFHPHLIEHAQSADLFALEPPKLTEVDEIAAKIEAEAEFLAGHSEAARSVVNFVKQLNEGVKRATGNAVDLKVLLPLGLAIYTFSEVGSEAVTPLWVTLGIFSFNSFVALHHPKPTVDVAKHEVVLDNQQEKPARRKSASSTSRKTTRRR